MQPIKRRIGLKLEATLAAAVFSLAAHAQPTVMGFFAAGPPQG